MMHDLVGQTCIFGVGSVCLLSSTSSGNVSGYTKCDLVTSPRIQAAILQAHEGSFSGSISVAFCSVHSHWSRPSQTTRKLLCIGRMTSFPCFGHAAGVALSEVSRRLFC